MRIGIEAQRIQRKKKHGMDIVAVEIIRQLQLIDTENEYFLFVKPDVDKDVIEETVNFKIVELPAKSYIDWELIALPKAVRSLKIDLLHCTSNTAPRRINIPLIVTVHDIIYLEKLHLKQGTWYQKLGNLYRRWNVPQAMKNASRIITVSRFEEANIRQRFPERSNDIYTVYNAASLEFRPIDSAGTLDEARKRYNLPNNFLFFLGNTDPKKNVRNVLLAYALYRENMVNALELVMPDLNEKYLSDMLDDIGHTSLREHIFLTGYIPNKELPLIYNLSQFFLYPSLRESFGIPILEAMQCGKAVITSTTSSMPEIADGAALLVDPKDPRAIAHAIAHMHSDSTYRKEMEQKGLERSRFFSWKKSAEQVLNHYKSLLHG
ncbi:MAG: glycosyltransferase [Bacteroidetes bacterium]|nr:glycosyltransferase [Bacteroidota bacterium]